MNEARQLTKSPLPVLVVLSYLNSKMLQTLEREQISGMDLSGNAVVITPDWFLRFSGQPNRFQSERKSINPYQGKAALVTRALIETPLYRKIDDLHRYIRWQGGELSLAMVSRTVSALEADLIAAPRGPWRVSLLQPEAALERLVTGWSRVSSSLLWRGRVRLPLEEFLPQIFARANPRVIVTGLGSMAYHTSFSLENVAYLYADSASDVLGDLPVERTERFPNLEIRYCKDPGAFFDPQPDEQRVVWASKLQSVLEGLNGDARLQDAVAPLRTRLIAQSRVKMLEAL